MLFRSRQFNGNAFDLMRRAERFLIDWLPVAGRIVPGKLERVDTPSLPVEAVREALANAFVHRDYADGSGSVGVALFDDRLEISSAGELHFGLTPEMLYQPHESKPWNPLMANVFYRRGHIETWGRGTLKIGSLMHQAGLPAPILHEQGGFVMMTFKLPLQHGSVNLELDDLLELILAQPGLRVAELASKTGKSPRTVERWLSRGSGFFANPTRVDGPWRIALEPIAKRTIYPRLPTIARGTKGKQDIRRETNIDDFL